MSKYEDTTHWHFERAPFEYLLREAGSYLEWYRELNKPRPEHSCPDISHEFFTCSASRNGTAVINYTSKAIQRTAIDDIPKVEALLAEAWKKMASVKGGKFANVQLCKNLEREVAVFIDSWRITGPLDSDEIRDFAIESIAPFYKAPALAR